MTYYMKQRIFSWRDKFYIYDPEGNECFYAEGEVFTFGKKLHLYDLNRRELAFIQQRLLSFLPKYEILRNGTHIAEVVKEFTLFRQEYSINGLGWKVHGDIFSHDYEITANGQRIARVSKEWFKLGDAYEIDIEDGADEVTALAVVLVIDACIEATRNNN
jgi:uncharacterized protein YxjI